MMNGLQSLPQWKASFGNPRGSLLGVMNAVNPVGKVLGLFPATWLGDRYGRTFPMWFGFAILPIGAALQGAAQNIPMFIVSRFFLGFSTSFLAQPSPILVTELAYPTHRAKLTSLYMNCFVVFWCCFGGLVYVRYLSIAIVLGLEHPFYHATAIPLLQACAMAWVPESPRWLVAHGKEEKAREILVRYHTGGGDQSLE